MEGRADNIKNAKWMLDEIKEELEKGMKAHISIEPKNSGAIIKIWNSAIKIVKDCIIDATGNNGIGIGYGNAFNNALNKLEVEYGPDKVKLLFSNREISTADVLNDKKNIGKDHYKRMIGLILNDIYTQIKTNKCVIPGDEHQKDKKFEPNRLSLDKIKIPSVYHDACKDMNFMLADNPALTQKL